MSCVSGKYQPALPSTMSVSGSRGDFVSMFQETLKRMVVRADRQIFYLSSGHLNRVSLVNHWVGYDILKKIGHTHKNLIIID